jgi:hypothetical protein
MAVSALGPKRVVIADDVDGLGILLAEAGIETVVEERDPVRRGWLEREAVRAGVGAALTVMDDAKSGLGASAAPSP